MRSLTWFVRRCRSGAPSQLVVFVDALFFFFRKRGAIALAGTQQQPDPKQAMTSFDHSPESISSHATRGLGDAIGIEIIELTASRVVATMPVDDRTRQPYGLLHGGASMALAETVASLGSIMNIDRQQFAAVGLEINANHIRAKREGIVRGTATPIHIGRSTHVWSVEIVDEEGRLVCTSRCTMAIIAVG